jgi:signal transduction histidine kinase
MDSLDPGSALLRSTAEAVTESVDWAGTEPRHAVQFYESDEFLHGIVADYLAAGARIGQPLLVVGTPTLSRALTERLPFQGLDLADLKRTGQLRFRDARTTLSRFMVGSTPDAELFSAVVGGALEEAREGRHVTVRAYGEMVDLLWRDGNAEGALRLEELWHELAKTHSFSLLCGYAMSNFPAEAQSSPYDQVCLRHTLVLPTESYAQASDAATRLREISLLQQRARALQREIEHRTELEGKLRQALAEHEQSLAEREQLLVREQAARAEVEAALRSRDEFLAVASHELRNPINALQLQLLGVRRLIARDQASTPSGTLERLTRTQEQVMRLVRLIDNLLDLSRIRSGRLDLVCEPLDVVCVVAGIAEQFAEVQGGGEIQIQAPPSIEGHGDRTRIEQVIANLVSNAVKYGAGKPVEIRLAADDHTVRVEVVDRGLGIPPEDRHRLFQRFERLSPDRNHGGFGLGLWITREVVDAMAGRIDVQSEPGVGTTFRVEFPRYASFPEQHVV